MRPPFSQSIGKKASSSANNNTTAHPGDSLLARGSGVGPPEFIPQKLINLCDLFALLTGDKTSTSEGICILSGRLNISKNHAQSVTDTQPCLVLEACFPHSETELRVKVGSVCLFCKCSRHNVTAQTGSLMSLVKRNK